MCLPCYSAHMDVMHICIHAWRGVAWQGGSKSNAGEARAVAAVLRALLTVGGLAAPDIGVVTPYAAQVR